ncbi:hypothetical protein BJX99DRAFT_101794 [Aspergillus californicus]
MTFSPNDHLFWSGFLRQIYTRMARRRAQKHPMEFIAFIFSKIFSKYICITVAWIGGVCSLFFLLFFCTYLGTTGLLLLG